MPKLTALAADKLTVKSGRKDFFDPAYPGLALRVSNTGVSLGLFLSHQERQGTSAPHDAGHISGDGCRGRTRRMASGV